MLLIEKSNNNKTGAMPVVYAPRKTCPPSCPHKDDGCYAESGIFTKLHWNRADASTLSYKEFASWVTSLPDDVWRYGIAGDLPGVGDRIDRPRLRQLTTANRGKRGYAYTHKPVLKGPHAAANREALKQANIDGFRVNLSADSLADADAKLALGIAPVVVVLPSTTTKNTVTPAGNRVVICPATIRDNVTCKTCQLCTRERSVIVGFPAHGTSKGKIDKRLAAQT